MKKTKTWKSVGALLLTVAMLAGMLSVVGVIPGSAKTTDAMKFTANFGELAKFVNDNNGTWTSEEFSVGYTPSSDTTSLNGQINTWMAERFVIYNTNTNVYARRAWLGQSSASFQFKADTYSGNTYFQVKKDGSLKYNSKTSGQMLRKPDMLAVQYNGELAVLRNFEAELVFTRLSVNTERSAVILDFHETKPGYVIQTEGDYKTAHSGNTIVVGNGAGSYTDAGKDGLAFWKQGVTMSATTIDSTASTNTSEVKTGDGKRFDNSLTSNAWYTLKVRVVEKDVKITLNDAAGNTVYTVDKKCDTTEGYLSFGFSNAAFAAKSFTVTELDSEGKQVDFGTNTMSKHDGVEVFDFDFSQPMPDVAYENGRYYYEPHLEHKKEVFVSDENHVLLPSKSGNATWFYPIDVHDTALVELLESKFDFFYTQEGKVFERPNVNGYATDASGKMLTSKAPSGSYAPDSGTSLGDKIDGVGSAGNSNHGVARISLVSGEYIGSDRNNAAAGPADSMFRKGFSMRVQGADGNPAVLHNFQLELIFNLNLKGVSAVSTYDYAPVFVSFGTTTPFYCGSKSGSMFAISRNGGYFLGSPSTTIKSGVQYNKNNTGTSATGNTHYDDYTNSAGVTFTEGQSVKNTKTGTLAGIYQDAVSGPVIGKHKLTLTVVGNTVRAVVKNDAGSTILDKTATITDAYGNLYIGNGNNGGIIGRVKVTRLADDSTMDNLIPVDFSDKNNGNTFSMSLAGAQERRQDIYYANDGQKGMNVDTLISPRWLKKLYSGNDPYAFGAGDMATELESKFNFYVNKEGRYGKQETAYQNSNNVPLISNPAEMTDNDSGKNAQWKKQGENILLATFTETQGEMFRKTLTVVPKIGDKEIVTANFETEFDATLSTNHQKAGVALGFRSQTPGKWTDAPLSMNPNRGMILMTRYGIYIADSAMMKAAYTSKDDKVATSIYNSPFANAENNANLGTYSAFGTPWNDSANPDTVHVYAKLVGSELTVKVTSLNGKTTYYEGTTTITYEPAGVLEYAVVGGKGGLSNIALDVLNANGDAVSSDATMQESVTATVSSVQTGLLGYNSSKEWGVSGKYPNGKDHGVVGEQPKFYTERATAAETEDDRAKYNELAAEVAASLRTEFLEYYNSRYDLYYNNFTDYEKHTINQNVSINGAGYGNAIYLNKWLQFGGTISGANTELIHFNSLVPKKDGNLLFGENVTAEVQYRFEYGDAAAIIGFRMATPGKYVDGDGNVLSDVSFIRVSKTTGIWLYEGGEEPRQISDQTFTTNQVSVVLTVKGDKLSVTVKMADSPYTVLASATGVTLAKEVQPGYVAATFAANRMDLGTVNFTVSDNTPIVDVAKDMVDGTIEVLGRFKSDRLGYYKYLVKAVPDADCQLKIGSLAATNGAEVSLLREGFRVNEDSNTFAVYTKGDTVVSAEFFTPHTAEEIDRKVLGTQKQVETGGLRFISRFAIDHDSERVATANIDGKAVAVTDYGVLVAVKSVLGTDALELATCETNQYVVKRSVKEEQVYYDYSSNYIDMSVKITGLAAPLYETLPIVSRGYLVLEDGTVVYTTVAETTYQNG